MSNFLEQLVAEWYELNGYFVRRNIQVGKREKGGYDGELDIVAFNPRTAHLVHIEPSMDCYSWPKREEWFSRKFKSGEKHIHALFEGLDLPKDIEKIALLGYAGEKTNRVTLGGGKLVPVGKFMREIQEHLGKRKVRDNAVPEQFPILRALQFAANYWD